MKKIAFFILSILLASCKAEGQNESKTCNLIAMLSNKSIIINSNYIVKYSLSEDAQKILEFNQQNKIKCLVNNLKVEEKALVSHIILTKIFEPDKDIFTYKYIYDVNGDVASTIYTLNNIEWKYDDSSNKNVIVNYNPDKFYNYWLAKSK